MKKLTKSARQKITQDWSSELTLLSIYKPLWLLKRNGPLLVGVCLDRDSSNESYEPIFHTHNLLIPSEDITLGSAQPLMSPNCSGLAWVIMVENHKDLFVDAVKRLTEQCDFLSFGNLNFSLVINHFLEYLKDNLNKATGKYPLGIYLDIYTLSSWMGYRDFSNEFLEYICSEVSMWPEHEFPMEVTEWKKIILDLSNNQETQNKILSQEIVKHKVNDIKNYQIIDTGEPVKFW